MKFITFRCEGLEQIGILTKNEKKVIPIDEVELSQEFFDMNDFIETHEDEDIKTLEKLWKEEVKADVYFEFEDVTLLAPIPLPLHDIISVGLNYEEHILDMAQSLNYEPKKSEFPIIFSKRARNIGGHGTTIPLHTEVTKKLDYEVELGIVIGKEVSKCEKQDVKDSIFGYTIMNDITAMDLMLDHKQWTIGKGLDGSALMGPCIVYKDYIDYPVKLDIKSKVNNEVRQDSNTENLIFNVEDLICELTKGITLEAGDIISTGTPSGVGASYNPPLYLNDGDIVECEIENIGILRNIVKA